MGRGVFRNYYYKGHMEKTKGEGGSREGSGFGWVGYRGGEKLQTSVIEQ